MAGLGVPPLPRTIRLAGAAALALALTAVCVPTASATGVVDPAPIGPGQLFTGLVNGTDVQAQINMACYGPVLPGVTGHPLPGQTVEVLPAPASGTTDVGYTGTAADRIDAGFGPSATTAPVTLTYYAVKVAIPTSLVLPCSGTGTVLFSPVPTSPSARSATLTVRYVGQP
ncbi:hypothetical protein ABIA32_006511 [Streptacidiphilus sp. MAP12-20]|uniref:hypothetical protein n=1 Tax=Streptacidiphilus sp. MAP12-20 TaxID=3156299 RepID=UPI00351527D8